MGGDHNDHLMPILPPNGFHHFHPIELWHVDVSENNLVLPRLKQLQSFLTILGQINFFKEIPQQLCRFLLQRQIIFYVEQANSPDTEISFSILFIIERQPFSDS